MRNSRATQVEETLTYISPRELARRWQCSRSSVDRIARRAGFKRYCLGDGKNGMVRYLGKEVEAYEASRQVVMA
jgi:DNA-binding MurR/RpiR family transcriptional regulator